MESVSDQTPVEAETAALVVGLAGLLDAGAGASEAASRLADSGEVVCEIDAEEAFSFSSMRPEVIDSEGVIAEPRWPRIGFRRVALPRAELLILTGAEPSLQWRKLSERIVDTAVGSGSVRAVVVGATAAWVSHTQPPPIQVRTTDPSFIVDSTVVSEIEAASFSDVIEAGLRQRGVPTVAFTAQLPFYVEGVYWPGVATLLRVLSGHLRTWLPRAGVEEAAARMLARLDRAVKIHPEMVELVERLENKAEPYGQPAGDEDINQLLADLGETTNPFR
mgnify:FL=1